MGSTAIISSVVALILVPPLLLLLWLFLAPRSLFALADRRVNRALDIPGYNARSDYSKPGFKPQHQELSHGEVRVEGTIPADLKGVYLRNGTNTQFTNPTSRVHMFNGAGMLHQVQISEGRATYSNTYVRTPRYEIEDSYGEEVYNQFGDLAGGGKPGFFKLILGLLKMRFGVLPKLETRENSSATTAIQYHHGKIYCLQETGYPFQLNTRVEEGILHLDGSGQWQTFDGKLEGPFTAHPKADPATGDWYGYSTDLMSGVVRYGIVKQGKLVSQTELFRAEPALAFLHDYFLTENFSIFPDLSMRFNSKGLLGEPASPFYFDPEYKMRFGLIPKTPEGAVEVQWFTTELPGHIWHVLNAWEEQREDGGTDIVLHAPVFRDYPSDVPIHSTREPHAHLWMYRLNVDTGEVTEQRELMDHFYERPSFNTCRLGQPTRYAYLLDEQASGGIMGKGVLKYDLSEEKAAGLFRLWRLCWR